MQQIQDTLLTDKSFLHPPNEQKSTKISHAYVHFLEVILGFDEERQT